ncbi:MAG: HAD hydrolase family protein [Burkholderiaceae bacterium]
MGHAPALHWPAELLLRAQGMRLLLLDVDGVLTDGGLYYGESGEVMKRFHTLDGHGLKLLARAGLQVGVISGRDSPALRQRLAALGIQHARLGTEDKLPAAQALLQELGIAWAHTAAMGDDWPDLPLLRHAGFACAPAQAHAEVRALATHVTTLAGGSGAVRELCDLLLAAGGHYRRLLEQHLGPAP